MSANIVYEPIRANVHELRTFTPDRIRIMLTRAFGPFPFQLNSGQLPLLQGMLIAFGDQEPNPFTQLLKAVEKYNAIEVRVIT